MFLGADTYENEGGEEQAVVARTPLVNNGDRIVATATDSQGNTSEFTFGQTKRVGTEREADLPAEFALHDGYPNPFNTYTTIGYDVPKPGPVSVEVYDMLGRRVRRLATGTREAGRHTVSLRSDGLPNGVYVVRLFASGATWSGTVALVK